MEKATPGTLTPEMSSDLADRTCVPCHGLTAAVPEPERAALLSELTGWAIVDGVLTRTVSVPDLGTAVELVTRIAPLAEQEGHHPDLHVSYGSLRIDLVTHAIDDLSDNDFILAAKINRLLSDS